MAMADGVNGAVKAYVRRMFAESGAGMKALLLDPATVRAVCVPSCQGVVSQLTLPLLALPGPLSDGHCQRSLLPDGAPAERGASAVPKTPALSRLRRRGLGKSPAV